MISRVCIVVALIALIIYLYGVLITITRQEKNTCEMTYMFEYPQFVKIHFRENEKFPKYNLYAYSEGRLTETVRNMKFNGAPVLFVHGNRGSYRQARSLASVALRKGIDNNWTKHLDYFTVDYDEEFSGLFGGILEDQKLFLELCVKKVLNLYKDVPNPPTSVAIVGHSMGGKIAQSVLMHKENAKMINTLIAIATPMDETVLNIDYYLDSFYRKSNTFWQQHRQSNDTLVTNLTNTCCNDSNYASSIATGLPATDSTQIDAKASEMHFLENILLVTIGGGSRDMLVRSALTTSRFSDVHTMASCMPNVWLTTDHLSSTWCLQQVLVINRFLYSIVQTVQSRPRTVSNYFIKDKSVRKARAKHYFTQDISEPTELRDVTLISNRNDVGDWFEDTRRVFTEKFKNGLNRTRVQMFRLNRKPNHQILNVEAVNVDIDDWVFGCAANEVDGAQRYCSRGKSLTHYIRKLPSRRYNRKTLTIDLHKIQNDYPDWTHVVMTLYPTKVPIQLNVDIHDAIDRTVTYQTPSWYSYGERTIVEDTIHGANRYRLTVTALDESYQAVEVHLQARCAKEKYHVVAKVCVPWTKGFEQFHFYTDEINTPLILATPISKPANYNSTLNPISVEFTLDPNCRYRISAKNSFAQTAARLVQQFSHWIPAHLVAILLLAFRHQIAITPQKEVFKCGSLTTAYSAGTTFFILTASRLFVKFLLWTKTFPDPDQFKHSLIISFVIHGSALAVLHLVTYGLWFAIAMCGNVAYQFLFKLTQIPVSAAIILPAIQKFPITIGTLLVSMVLASCGALPLICAVVVYFVLIAKMYEDYLEEFVFKTTKIIAEKLFGKISDDDAVQIDGSAAGATQPLPIQPKQAAKNAENTSDAAKIIAKESNNGEDRSDANGTQATNVPDEAKETKADQKSNASSGSGVEDEQMSGGAVVERENSFEVLYNQLDPADIAEMTEPEPVVDPSETEEERQNKVALEEEMDAELEKLMSEMMARQKEDDTKREKEMMATRVEYDAVVDGLSAINFHLTLFLLLCIMAALNIPTAIAWAHNFSFGEKILQNDPSFFPAIASIISLSIIWQMPTPRNVYGYESMSTLCYLMAIICVLYCQDSLYRLNAIISGIFIITALQQLFMPKMQAKRQVVEETGIDIDLMERVRRLKEDMAAFELKTPPTAECNEHDQAGSIPER